MRHYHPIADDGGLITAHTHEHAVPGHTHDDDRPHVDAAARALGPATLEAPGGRTIVTDPVVHIADAHKEPICRRAHPGDLMTFRWAYVTCRNCTVLADPRR